MKNKCFILTTLSCMLISCNCFHDYYDSYYIGESNYSQYYIVDTITIDNPIIAKKNGTEFVFSKSLLDITDDCEKDFTNRPDVFILLDETNLFLTLKPHDFQKYYYREKEAPIIQMKDIIYLKGKKYERYSKQNVRFVLCLYNVNLYNKSNSCIDCESFYMIKNNDYKNAYYKVVYPILVNNL